MCGKTEISNGNFPAKMSMLFCTLIAQPYPAYVFKRPCNVSHRVQHLLVGEIWPTEEETGRKILHSGDSVGHCCTLMGRLILHNILNLSQGTIHHVQHALFLEHS